MTEHNTRARRAADDAESAAARALRADTRTAESVTSFRGLVREMRRLVIAAVGLTLVNLAVVVVGQVTR